MHIRGAFESEMDIECTEVDIESTKLDIRNQLLAFSSTISEKTISHALEILSQCGKDVCFGRTIVEDITGLKSSVASNLIKLVNYPATSYRASCFNHHCLRLQRSSNKSYTMSTSVRFGLFHPYHVFCLYRLQNTKSFIPYIYCGILVTVHNKPAVTGNRAEADVLHFRVNASAAVTGLA